MKKLIAIICIILSFSIAQADRSFAGQGMVTMFDYGTPEGMSKTFAHAGLMTTITCEIGIETWMYSDGHKVEYLTAPGPDGTLDIGRREYDTLGIMTQDLTYFPAVQGIDLLGPKKIGKIWGNAYIAKKPDGNIYGPEVNMYSIIGIETVTVPAGTFANCAIVFHTTGNYKDVAWYAAGFGMVKRIGVNGLMELQNYTP